MQNEHRTKCRKVADCFPSHIKYSREVDPQKVVDLSSAEKSFYDKRLDVRVLMQDFGVNVGSILGFGGVKIWRFWGLVKLS